MKIIVIASLIISYQNNLPKIQSNETTKAQIEQLILRLMNIPTNKIWYNRQNKILVLGIVRSSMN